MAISRLKTWSSGEVLTASDLNAEINNILNNPVSLWSPAGSAVDFDGQTITLDAAAATTVASSAAVSWNFTSGAKTGTPATTGAIANWSAQTFTDNNTAGSGTAASFVAHGIQRPTLAATNATVTTTNAATLYIANAPAAGTNETLTNAYALWIDDGRVRLDPSATVVSAASATLDAVNITAQTATITGSTNITTATGVNFVNIGTPTISAASALTVTNAATMYIAAAPTGAGAGPATITNAYGLWVDAGNVRFDDDIHWRSGTGFAGIFAHNNAAERTYTFPDRDLTLGLVSGTEVASTSGTSIDFTSIPSWARKIVIQFIGVSTNGTDQWLIQLGDAGGIEATGYLGTAATVGGTTSATAHTAGFGIESTTADAVIHGAVTLTLEDSSDFTWVASGVLARSDAAFTLLTAGRKATSAALDRVRITTTGGANTFDAGAINILYE